MQAGRPLWFPIYPSSPRSSTWRMPVTCMLRVNENVLDREKGVSDATEQEVTWARIQRPHFTNSTAAEARGVAPKRMLSSCLSPSQVTSSLLSTHEAPTINTP